MESESKKSAWINPLPIIMVLLLAGGVLVKNIPLESSRPVATERVKFVPTGLQNVEARLWQDPFAAVEEHESRAERSPVTEKPELSPYKALRRQLKLFSESGGEVTILAVSVFGDSYAESAESRRRSRYAVISALGFHDFYPKTSNAIGYMRLSSLYQSDQNSKQEMPGHAKNDLAIPFEWFNHKKSDSKVLLLWLNESLYEPDLIFNRLPASFGKYGELTLIGPAGSAMLLELVGYPIESNGEDSKQARIFSPTATIDNCALLKASGQEMSAGQTRAPWRCFYEKNESLGKLLSDKKIVRTIGTDDVLSISLLWELWHRGINRDQRWAQTGKHSEPCNDGLVLISEWDSAYSRALAGNLTESFSALCQTQDNHQPPVRHFTYLRGIDGVVPGMERMPPSKTPRQSNEIQAHDLRSQLDSAAPELAEGLSQYDYLRRLVDEIAQLDQDPRFAKHGVRAIGITGSDVYDKLLILQALRSRFKGKIFFTTDLDARFLHADQKDWTRNLVIASNFNLTLHPLLQLSSLPFRDGYQTSTYLATLMALTSQPIDHWENALHEWLRPSIYEIGRTMAVPIASPSVNDLIQWIGGFELKGISRVVKPQPCDDWTTCKRIEPHTELFGTSSLPHWHLLAFGSLIILWIAISSKHAQKWIKAAAICATSSAGISEASIVLFWSLVLIIMTVLTTVIVGLVSESSLEQGIGEPMIWLEGISVWPNITIRFIGFVTTLGLILAFIVNIRRQIDQITDRFCLAIPSTWSLSRSQFSAMWNGPNLDLTLYDARGNPTHPTSEIEVTTLWKNYLRATSWHEKGGWIIASAMIAIMLSMILFTIFDMPAFPHRGELVRYLNYILLGLITPLLGLIVLWIGYENCACTQLVESLGKTRRIWPDALFNREESETGVPRAGLDPYLCFHLVIAVTQRIQALVYLPFILLFFIVIARSDLFGALVFPLPLVIIVITALFYTLYTARLVRKSAENVRTQLLTQYDLMLLQHARPGAQSIRNVEQINRLANQIRTTHAGAYSFFLQRPTLLALLLPFGGFGGAQLIEYLFTILS